MTSQETVKVYELAKELGIDSISLVDKLKDLEISVKSHMSSLTHEDATLARNTLKPKKAEGTKKPKKVARRKTAAKKAATATTPIAKKAATAVKKKSSGKAAAPVIRRRSTSEGEIEAPTIPTADTKVVRKRSPGTESITIRGPETTKEAPTSLDDEPAQEISAQMTETAAHEPIVETKKRLLNVAEPVVKKKAPEKAAPPVKEPEPKRSFLNIVKPSDRPKPKKVISKPKEKPKTAGSDSSQEDPSQIIKMNKETLDRMAEEEAAKKRSPSKTQTPRPEDMKFSDYQKKTIFFVPKRKKVPVGKELRKTQITTPKAQKRVIEINETISVQDLANRMGIKANQIIRKLMEMGQMATINQALDFETAELIATDYKYEAKNVTFNENVLLDQSQDAEEDLSSRPPVVTVMGHVDHGKTSLLDAIRDATVAEGEAGGITQHIGAYTIEKDGKDITFIDTPGHEAFSLMRARGGNVSDICIIVVAADDGVMPQTREAVNHAKAAGATIIVAVNKIDKPGANEEKIKQELSELELLPEDWGGQTMFVPVSAKEKTNLDKLLDAINLNAEMLELKGNPNARASGSVLEAKIEKGKGAVVSVVVKRGTLRVGDAIVAGLGIGKIRALTNHLGQRIESVGPGMAAEILGFDSLPNSGDRFDSPENDGAARKILSNRKDKEREKSAVQKKVSLEDLFAQVESGNVKELKVVLKADVFGSVEAVRDSLMKLSNEKVKVEVIHAAAGGITESDVLLASASNALILGFNVRPETNARKTAEKESIEIKCYNIIYELIDEVKQAMTGLLDKKKEEKYLGRAEVRQTFTIPKIGLIAGCGVIDGKIVRGAELRLLRDSVVIFEGKMTSLKRFKDDAKEVSNGFECGIGIENYNDVKVGDVIEAYQIEWVAQTLEE